jgi:hypothetical protein
MSEQISGLEAQLFSLGACGGGQPAAFGIPHTSVMTGMGRSSRFGEVTSALQPQLR